MGRLRKKTHPRRGRGGKELDYSVRGAIVALRDISGNARKPSFAAIGRQLGYDRSTVRKVYNHALANAASTPGDNELIADIHVQPSSRPGQPPVLSKRDKDALITHATANKVQREKTWQLIAHELGIEVSRPTIYKAFRERGYGRYTRTYKPFLTRDMRLARRRWCSKHLDYNLDIILFTDESPIVATAPTGNITRNQDEKWHDDCVDTRVKESTGLMFWGAIAKNWKGPCYIFEAESKADRKAIREQLMAAAQPELDRRMIEYYERLRYYEDQKARKEDKSIPSKIRTKILTGRRPAMPKIVDCGPMRTPDGTGIDWYRYVNEVIKPVLLPDYRRFEHHHLPRGDQVYLMQDGAPAHRSKETHQLLEDLGIKVLDWPGNSPDLNPIEHIWDLIKERIRKRYGLLTDLDRLKQAWIDEWEALSVTNDINPQIDRLPRVMQKVIDQRGGNRFHG